MSTLLKQSISEDKLLEILIRCFNIPGLDNDKKEKWIRGFSDLFFNVYVSYHENKISEKIYNFFRKYKIVYEGWYMENSKLFIRREDIIRILLNAKPLLTKIGHQINVIWILYDYIFNEKGLYKDILLNYTILADTIYKKINEFNEQDGGKYKKYFEDYLTKHYQQSQKILLF